MDSTQRIRAILSFVQAADAGSFAGAARALGISAAAVGKNIAGLEAALGVRLMNRTTRTMNLTEEGEAYLEELPEQLGGSGPRLDQRLRRVIEQPRGEAYYYVRGNGTKNLDRFRVRTPTSQNLAGLTHALQGVLLANVPMIILTIDPCISCTER